MKKNKHKHSIRRKLFYCFTMFFIGIVISFKYIEKNISIKTNEKYDDFILENAYEGFSNKTFLEKYKSFFKTEQTKDSDKSLLIENPIVYIYNTHDTEEYAANNLFQFSPNVTMINYILKEKLEQNNIKTIVEERSIKDLLNTNNWNYASSYKASRIYLDEVRNSYPSIQYFLDIHRDSLTKDKTTISINDKNYAKILFLIGLENNNYEENYAFASRINDKLNIKFPGLSKGILKKGGQGVNGVYNQDVSSNALLIEFGGYENTTYEVINSALAFFECFMEVINEG